VDLAAKIAETFRAPCGSELPADDMRVIEREDWYQTITPSTKSTQGNEVTFSRVAAEHAERVVRETIDEYAALGLPFKWSVGPLTEPSDFGDVLERLGFTYWQGRGMAIEPARWSSPPHSGVTIERVTQATFDDYYTAFVRGWGAEVIEAPSWRTSMRRALEGRHRYYLARVDGEPAGSGGFAIKPRSVYLVGGNVFERFRGRGVYRALIDARVQDAAALGIPLVTTIARDATSAPILEGLGFETLFPSRVYKYEP